MSRIRLVMLSVLSMLLVLAASAVMSASPALAEGPACGELQTKDLVVCVEKEKSNKKEEYEHLLGTSDRQEFGTPATLKSKILGVAATIECKKYYVENIIEDSNTGKGNIEFLECKLSQGPAGCKLSTKQENIIVAKVKPSFVGGGTHQIKFSPEGAAFVEIEVEGTCGTFTLKVVGSQKCKLINATTLEALKKVECKGSESELKLGLEKAEFEGIFEHIEVLGTENKVDSQAAWEGFLWAEGES